MKYISHKSPVCEELFILKKLLTNKYMTVKCEVKWLFISFLIYYLSLILTTKNNIKYLQMINKNK